MAHPTLDTQAGNTEVIPVVLVSHPYPTNQKDLLTPFPNIPLYYCPLLPYFLCITFGLYSFLQ